MAVTAGRACAGDDGASGVLSGPYDDRRGQWSFACHPSDDPWPIVFDPSTGPVLKAFYNPARDFFTGTLAPGQGVDPGPFYNVVSFSRTAHLSQTLPLHSALLVGNLDGKVRLVENSTIRPVAGTRDWGSDFALLHTTCAIGNPVIASASGESLKDSLRAYELINSEASPISAALDLGGSVISLATAADETSVYAIVRKSSSQYEVDSVSAVCP